MTRKLYLLFPRFVAYDKLEATVKEKFSIRIIRLGIRFPL